MKCQADRDGDDPVDVEGRKNTQRAAGVKVFQRDGALLFVLLKQEPGDKEAADDEESKYTVPCWNYVVARVVKDNGCGTGSAKKVELGNLSTGHCTDCTGMGVPSRLNRYVSHR